MKLKEEPIIYIKEGGRFEIKPVNILCKNRDIEYENGEYGTYYRNEFIVNNITFFDLEQAKQYIDEFLTPSGISKQKKINSLLYAKSLADKQLKELNYFETIQIRKKINKWSKNENKDT